MAASEEIVNGSIVCIGAFAPAMFTADWLRKNNLIGDTDQAEMMREDHSVISSSGTKLETDTFSIGVSPTRFQIVSKDVLRPTIKDLAIGIIQLLGRVQVSSVGLNFMAHYRTKDFDEYHLFGDSLVPKSIWNTIFPNENGSIGLADLAVKIHPSPREARDDTRDGVTIRVQPSAQVELGIFLTYNNHKEINHSNPKVFSDEVAVDFVRASWEESLKDSKRVFSRLVTLATQKARE